MRYLFVLSVLMTVFFIGAPAAHASADYCAPEFGSCEGNPESGTFGSGYGTGGGGGNGTYEKTYGSDYSACAATGSTYCLRCEYNFKLKGTFCTGVRYAGSCYCVEKYENYIVRGCSARGTCDYFYE